jgi:hypothetical protein
MPAAFPSTLSAVGCDLRSVGKPGQRPPPEGIQLILQRTQRHGVDAVHPSGASYLVDHHTGVLEHPKMLRHRRPADRQTIGKLTHRTRTLSEHSDDLPT